MARSLLLVLSTMRARSSLPCFGALDLQGSLIHLDKPVRIGWLDRDSGNAHFAWLTHQLHLVRSLRMVRSSWVVPSHQCRVRSANLARSHVRVPSYRVAHSSVLVRSGPLARSQGAARSVDWACSHILAPSMRMAHSNSLVRLFAAGSLVGVGARSRGRLALVNWCSHGKWLALVIGCSHIGWLRFNPPLPPRFHPSLHPSRIPALIPAQPSGSTPPSDEASGTRITWIRWVLSTLRPVRGRSADSDTGGPGQKDHSSSSVG